MLEIKEPNGIRIKCDLLNKAFRFQYASFFSPPKVGLHLHDDYEIFFLLEGDVTYSVEGNSYALAPYDIMITNTKEIHAPIFLSNTQYRRITLTFQRSFLAEFFSDDFSPLNIFEHRAPGMHNRIDNKYTKEYGLDKIIADIETALRQNDSGTVTLIKVYLMLLLIKLSKTVTFSGPNDKQDNRITEVYKYIDENLSGDLSYEAISRHTYISQSYLGYFFQKNTGFPLGAYIAKKRISRAKELLLTGTPSTLLPEACGFGDYSNFYRCFKKETGRSPKEFLENASYLRT